MLLALLTTVTFAGCTNDPAAEPKPAASPHSESAPSQALAPTTATGTPPRRLKPPSAVAGELSRRVLVEKDGHPEGQTILRRSAHAGLDYGVQAACASASPGKTLSVEVRSARAGASDDAVATFEIACDATVTINGVGELPAEPIGVYLRGDQSDVSSAYAIIAPTPSLQVTSGGVV